RRRSCDVRPPGAGREQAAGWLDAPAMPVPIEALVIRILVAATDAALPLRAHEVRVSLLRICDALRASGVGDLRGLLLERRRPRRGQGRRGMARPEQDELNGSPKKLSAIRGK